MAHAGLPRPDRRIIRRSELLSALSAIDQNRRTANRVLALETEFRRRITAHIASLPSLNATFDRFKTSPFVLMIHCLQRAYSRISEIEKDILPAKQFSSMETSAGRMVETVALPAYGWDVVASQMHTENSALDGKRRDGNTLKLATLKSGPRCLNDEMSENFASSIIENFEEWARQESVERIDFTYGVLYGTPRQSNKKDWHILRNIDEKSPVGSMTVSPAGRWDCAFNRKGVEVHVAVRIGTDWWTYLGGPTCHVEVCSALIRACVQPGDADPDSWPYMIPDLKQVVSLQSVPAGFNVSILQRSQLPWLFFLARHFCDSIDE